jgi:HPt (histidine-containing phosphotransfer) domain-containing protein
MAHYDLSELEAMSLGNKEFIKKMIDVFLDTTLESLNEMIAFFKEGKIKEVGGLAHKIKPSIDLMGITILKPVVRAIELSGKANGEDLEELIPKLEKELILVFNEMKSEFQ